MRVTSYGEARYLKAYLEFCCGQRRTLPPAASYKIDRMRAHHIRFHVDALLNSYYRRRRTRRSRVISPSEQGGT